MLQKLGVVGFLLTFGLIVFATLAPIELRPNSGHLHVERISAFFALGATLCFAYPRRWTRCLLTACALAGGLEYAQTFIPTRDGRLGDALEKCVGAAAGVLAGELARWGLRANIRDR